MGPLGPLALAAARLLYLVRLRFGHGGQLVPVLPQCTQLLEGRFSAVDAEVVRRGQDDRLGLVAGLPSFR